MKSCTKLFIALILTLSCFQISFSADNQFQKQNTTTKGGINSQVLTNVKNQDKTSTSVVGSTTSTTTTTIAEVTTTTLVESKTNPPTTSKRHDLKPLSKKVPNPEAGVYIVVIFLVIVGIIIISFLIFVIVREKRRRTYRDPTRDNLRGTPHSTDFDNPIQFPTSPYHSAVI